MPVFAHVLPQHRRRRYILQPPCLWGSTQYPNGSFGLDPAPNLDGVTMHTIKTSNATAGHHGEMAWQQMFMTAPIAEEEN